MLRQIAQYAALTPSDYCIEIGPGEGALTQYLLTFGSTVLAVEIDSRLQPVLEKIRQEHSHFDFILNDVLALNLHDILPKDQSVKVIGNLPYEISTPLLFKLAEYAPHIHSMTFLLQKEVVDRITAPKDTKAYGRLSVMMQYFFTTKALREVGPGSFSPPPKVQSQVVQLFPRDKEPVDEDYFASVVKYLFAHRRKMLRSRFKGLLIEEDWISLGLNPESRPQNLSVDDCLRMTRLLQEKGIDLSAGGRV